MNDTYFVLAHFAQSWGLLYFFLVFCGVVIFAMRPSGKKLYEQAARLPLNED